VQTRFSDSQRQDPAIRQRESILRNCVHCGFCAATCPTYTLLGDELDSPRGRIYLIKDMLENGRPASAEIVRHLDRCLSCLACMTTCPSGVHYQHLIDHARAHIEATYRRPFFDRWQRRFLTLVMPYPRRFRFVLRLAFWLRPLRAVLPKRLAAALALVPERMPPATPFAAPASGRSARIGLMTGCVQSVLGASANAATARLLARMGCEVVEIAGCCGALTHHLGRGEPTRQLAAEFLAVVAAVSRDRPLEAIAINASGCGTHVKDLGFVMRDETVLADDAAATSALALDVTELVARRGLPPVTRPGRLRVAYHAACSLQHGQRIHEPPRQLLQDAGFEVVEIPEGHLCCGSAGTYNMLQPELAASLARRKLERIESLGVDCVAAGNLGCITQLGAGAKVPVVHTVELLDWATGGPAPVSFGSVGS